MKPNISECQTFMTYDSMKFMAFEANGYGCGGCHFHLPLNRGGRRCSILGRLSTKMCDLANRTDGRSIIWMRIE